MILHPLCTYVDATTWRFAVDDCGFVKMLLRSLEYPRTCGAHQSLTTLMILLLAPVPRTSCTSIVEQGLFDRLEELVGASEENPDSIIVSIGVLDGHTGERRTVITCPSEQADDVANITRDLRVALQKSTSQDKRARLLAIATVARELYSEVVEEEDQGR